MSTFQRLAALIGPARFLRFLRIYPPYLGAGVRVRLAKQDLSRVEVEMPLHPWNQNFVGTHFGGSLYSMCDPFFMLMLMTRLGPGYVVWDKSAEIEFIHPGRGTVTATFEILDARVEEIRRDADANVKVFPRFVVTIVDHEGRAVARVAKTLYVRRRQPVVRVRSSEPPVRATRGWRFGGGGAPPPPVGPAGRARALPRKARSPPCEGLRSTHSQPVQPFCGAALTWRRAQGKR